MVVGEVIPNDGAAGKEALHRAAQLGCPHADRLAAMHAWRGNRSIGVVHGCNAKPVDSAKRLQELPVEFDPMSGDGFCERIGKPDPIGSLIERDEIMRLQFAQNVCHTIG